MALQMLDYQSYIWNEYPLTAHECRRCDEVIYHVGEYYPYANNVPKIMAKRLPDGDNLFTNPNFTGNASGWTLDGFAYDDNNVCLDNTYPPTFTPSISQTIDTTGLSYSRYEIKFNYTNQGFVDNPFSIKMEVYDDTNVLVDTQIFAPIVSLTNKEITLYWDNPNTSASDDYTFWFYLVFDDNYSITQTTGFCLDSFSIYGLDDIAYMSQGFLNNSPRVLTWTEELYKDLILIEISDLDTSTNDCFRLHIGTENGDLYISNLIKLDVNNVCKVEKQILITWADDCLFKDLDYAHLPFTNAWYLKGFVQDLPNANKERIQRVNIDGTVDTVYNYSIGKAEVRIGAYTKYVHRIMARALEHKTVTIDGEYYMLDEGSSYTTASLDNGLYTGRCELIRVGSEVVKSLCCC